MGKFKNSKMKKVFLFFLLLSGLLPIFATAQIQIFGKYTPGPGEGIEPDINIFGYAGSINKSESLKLTYFALVEKSWAEGLVGISYTPIEWCELGFQFGLETTPSIYRLCGSVFLALNSKTTFFLCAEKGDGRDNWWYKTILSHCPKSRFSFGIMSWRYNGTGVFVKYTFLKDKIGLWVNPAYDFEFKTKRMTIGLDIKI